MSTEQERVCQRLKLEYKIFELKEFAAYWCGIPPEDIPSVLDWSIPLSDNAVGAVLVSSSEYPCLETKIRFLIDAIEEGTLINCTESGDERNTYIAWKRCHVSGRRAREFFLNYCKEHNDELPDFLFPDIEGKKEYTELEEKLKILEDENPLLREENDRLKKNDIKTHGAYTQVQRMRQERLSEKYIATALYSNGNWLSHAQIGALLHPKGDIKQASLKDYGQDLLNGKVEDFIFFDKYR